MSSNKQTGRLVAARRRWKRFTRNLADPGVRLRYGWIVAGVGVLIVVVATSLDTGPVEATVDDRVSVTGVLDDVRADRVDRVVLDEVTGHLTVTYLPGKVPVDLDADAAKEAAGVEEYTTTVLLPAAYTHAVIAAVDAHRVPFTVSSAAVTSSDDGVGVVMYPPASEFAAETEAEAVTRTGSERAAEAGDPAGAAPEADRYPDGGASAAPVAPDRKNTTTVIGLLAAGLLCAAVGLGLVISSRRRPRTEAAASSPAAVAAGGRSGRAATRAAEAVEAVEVPTTRFADVAGCDEAIEELSEMVLFLREPDRFTRTGAKPPKGALLAGPPGTGKTLLARAVAGEAGVPFFSAAGSDFTEMYVGVGAKRVRALFASARKHERAIIFIDEIDAVARKRGGEAGPSNGETENTLVSLLAEMDGFDASNVIVLAATNRADTLDPAITRPGRLDRRVEVPNPDRRGREKILEVHCAGKPVAGNVDMVALARRTPGFSGAQLSALVNEACLEAVRRDLLIVTQDCFDAAVATVAMGRARTSALVTDHDREVTAWHEAGHTLAAYLQPHADDPVQVTIVPRGPAGGVTWMSGSDDLFLPKRKAHAQLVTALAGRAGEEALLGGEYTSGASGDLASATQLATAMATQYGMTRLGYQVRNSQSSPASTTDVVEELLAAAHRAATRLLGEHRDFLAAVATRLLDVETLTLADVDAIAAECGVDRLGRPIDLALEIVVTAATSPEAPVPVPVPALVPVGAVAATVTGAGVRAVSVREAGVGLLRAVGAGIAARRTRHRRGAVR